MFLQMLSPATCVGAFSLSNELETYNHPFYFHKKKQKNIYTVLEIDKAARGISFVARQIMRVIVALQTPIPVYVVVYKLSRMRENTIRQTPLRPMESII